MTLRNFLKLLLLILPLLNGCATEKPKWTPNISLVGSLVCMPKEDLNNLYTQCLEATDTPWYQFW